MAIFIGIKETAGDYELKDKKTGEMKSGTYHNFMFSYIDEAAITANTVDTTKYECKVVAEKIKTNSNSLTFYFVEEFHTFYLLFYFEETLNILSIALQSNIIIPYRIPIEKPV